MSGSPPGEIVEGLRNPYLDKYVPPRRREATEAYRNYQPLMPRYVHAPIADLETPSDTATFDAAVDDLVTRLEQGALVHRARSPAHTPAAHAGAALPARNEYQRGARRAGERLYVHCWGGRGRSGLAGACLLVRAYGVSAGDALERVQRAFSTRGDHKERSPETEDQSEWVRAYAERVGPRQ